ncbi:U-box-domain-containing protein [Basidiobolus meristosporus CBS 931.73]|uniref:U-box-domain-containing protein n=1 Tax=Basidiobolus meristosporus CBS 931.73 TaxID=1314790 RepID=A0A1Y1YNW3_9FUNG|nr:U-box-domain-containing protein [Basidiobolus meristosporus CBS 931.73]|eukprot:ORX99665.1 U-box-domain-containing protein [Basidiobolus meristosporus CBS 931.73]
MRLIDFACFPEFGVKLSSPSIARDGHELTTLLRTTKSESIGFLCERFVKPPVEITIEFKHPISLTGIVVNPKLGIHTLQVISFSASAGVSSEAGSQYTFCGKLEYQENKLKYIGCYNPDFQLDEVYEAMTKAGTKCISKQDLAPFSRGLHGLHNIKSLKITVLRVQKSGIPGLRYLEIWGQPSRRCALTLQQSVWDCWSERLQEIQQSSQDDEDLPEFTDPFLTSGGLRLLNSSQNYRTHAKKRPRVDTPKIDAIPNEFLDAITFELMSDPITLPSGNIFRGLPLVRHLETQANDPFTRLPMSLKDLTSNILLKNRIAKWSLDSVAKEQASPDEEPALAVCSNQASEGSLPSSLSSQSS